MRTLSSKDVSMQLVVRKEQLLWSGDAFGGLREGVSLFAEGRCSCPMSNHQISQISECCLGCHHQPRLNADDHGG